MIPLIYIHRSYNQLAICRSTLAKYLNEIVVRITVLLCDRGSRNPLKIILQRERNMRVKPSCVLFIQSMFVDHAIHSQSFLRRKRDILIKSCYGLFISFMFMDHAMGCKCILRRERNIRVKPSCVLFIQSMPWIMV